MGWYACCVCGEKVPGGAHSVLTCVTCASAVWLVDWMNIGWVSSCPAGIVTCWIWYNCCKTERQTERLKVGLWLDFNGMTSNYMFLDGSLVVTSCYFRLFLQWNLLSDCVGNSIHDFLITFLSNSDLWHFVFSVWCYLSVTFNISEAFLVKLTAFFLNEHVSRRTASCVQHIKWEMLTSQK